VAEALAEPVTPPLEARLREAYARNHETLTAFRKRRGEILAHLASRRDGCLRRRELLLYVFNQVFRKRFLDAEIERALSEVSETARSPALLPLLGRFFFKTWRALPTLSLDEVEAALSAEVRERASREVETLGRSIRVEHAGLLRILGEIADGQASSIFDTKYKEHPQAAYRRALFLFHRDEQAKAALGEVRREGFDLLDCAHVPGLPFEVLQVTEIDNLPFRALRQYASLDRQAG
jgi:hypothetical protein